MKKIIPNILAVVVFITSVFNVCVFLFQKNMVKIQPVENLYASNIECYPWSIFDDSAGFRYPNIYYHSLLPGYRDDYLIGYIDLGFMYIMLGGIGPKSTEYLRQRTKKTVSFEGRDYIFDIAEVNHYSRDYSVGLLGPKETFINWPNTERSAHQHYYSGGLQTYDDDIIFFSIPLDPAIVKLENRAEVTEQLAKEYFDKYKGILFQYEVDENSEYRFSSVFEDTEYHRLLNEYAEDYSYETYEIYYFRKYVNGEPTYEKVSIYFRYNIYEDEPLLIITCKGSAPLLTEDAEGVNLYNEKITKSIEKSIKSSYCYDDYKDTHGKIVKIDSSERRLSKNYLGARSVISYNIVEFETGEKAFFATTTNLESIHVYNIYTFVPFIIIESALLLTFISLVVFLRVRRRRYKKFLRPATEESIKESTTELPDKENKP